MKYHKRLPWVTAVRRMEFEKEWDEYQQQTLQVTMWNDDEFKTFLAKILKPQYKDQADKIYIHPRYQGQQDASFDGLLFAYRSCGILWIYRGNDCHIFSATHEEFQRGEHISPEYAVYPSLKSDERHIEIPK